MGKNTHERGQEEKIKKEKSNRKLRHYYEREINGWKVRWKRTGGMTRVEEEVEVTMAKGTKIQQSRGKGGTAAGERIARWRQGGGENK